MTTVTTTAALEPWEANVVMMGFPALPAWPLACTTTMAPTAPAPEPLRVPVGGVPVAGVPDAAGGPVEPSQSPRSRDHSRCDSETAENSRKDAENSRSDSETAENLRRDAENSRSDSEMAVNSRRDAENSRSDSETAEYPGPPEAPWAATARTASRMALLRAVQAPGCDALRTALALGELAGLMDSELCAAKATLAQRESHAAAALPLASRVRAGRGPS